jgi:iron complex transport system ATP-binding protein
VNARHLVDFSRSAPLLPTQLEASGVAVNIFGKTLLQAASARFEAGQITAILGPNGAGKSTFMSALTGQRKASQGRIELAGQALQTYLPGDLARKRAFLAQESQVAFDFTVREVVELGRYPHRRQPSRHEATIALQAMQATAVDHLSDRPLNTLSGGEKARVHLARALAQVWHGAGERSNCWLLLDEPTAALDLQHQHRMLQLVRDWACQQGIGVVAVLHDLNLALRYSDRCVLLQGGQVAASGVTREVLTPMRIRQVWGVLAQPVPPGTAGQVLQYVFESALEDTAHPGFPHA